MRNSFTVIILLFCIYGIFSQTVKVSVFYEALCPGSQAFIDDQLYPTYKNIGNYIEVDLVPFGNAKVTNESGKLEFECQHGPEECYANMIQSCAIALYSVEKSTEFIYCDMELDDPSSDENLEKCANSSDISWSDLETCYTSGQAEKLLEANGVRTKAVPITFTPTITFSSDHYNQTWQHEAVVDLTHAVCLFLDYKPAVCDKYV